MTSGGDAPTEDELAFEIILEGKMQLIGCITPLIKLPISKVDEFSGSNYFEEWKREETKFKT